MSKQFADPPQVRSKLAAGGGMTVTTLPLKFVSGHSPQPLHSQGQAPKSVGEALNWLRLLWDDHTRRIVGVSGYYAAVEIDPVKNTVFTVGFAPATHAHAARGAVIDPVYVASHHTGGGSGGAAGSAIPPLLSLAGSDVIRLPVGAKTPVTAQSITSFDHKFVVSTAVPVGATRNPALKAHLAEIEKTGCVVTDGGLTAGGEGGGDTPIYVSAGVHNPSGITHKFIVKVNSTNGVATKPSPKTGTLPAVVVAGGALITTNVDSKSLTPVPALSVRYQNVFIHCMTEAGTGTGGSGFWISGFKASDWLPDDSANKELPFIDRYVRPFSAAELTPFVTGAKAFVADTKLYEIIASYAAGTGENDGYMIRYPLFHGCKPHGLLVPHPLGAHLLFACQSTSSVYTLHTSSGVIECLAGPNEYHPPGSDKAPKDGDATQPIEVQASSWCVDRKEHALYYLHATPEAIVRKIKLPAGLFEPAH